MNTQIKLLRKHYNSVSGEYDRGYDNPLNRGEDELIMGIIKKYPHKNLLDMGCGTGFSLEYLDLQELDKFLGVDMAEDMLKIAKRKFSKAKFILQDMHSIPEKDNIFDLVMCLYGTFSYSKEPAKLLAEVKRVLKPGGHMIIMPYSLRVKYRIMLGYCAKSYDPKLNVNYYTHKMLHTIKESGFSIEHVYGINYFGNLIEPCQKGLKKIGLKVPDLGYGYLKKEFRIMNKLNDLLGNHLTNMGRHIMIVTKLKK